MSISTLYFIPRSLRSFTFEGALMKILIVVVDSDGVSGDELPQVASGNEVEILSGLVTTGEFEATLRASNFEGIFLGQHGDHGILEFADGLLSQERLSLILRRQDSLKLVFINACNSAGTAGYIHTKVKGLTVIAHTVPVSDWAAVRYAQEFFRAVRDGCYFEEAHSAAHDTTSREASRLKRDFVEPIYINGSSRDIERVSNQLELIELRLAPLLGLPTQVAAMQKDLSSVSSRVDSMSDELKKTTTIIQIPRIITLILLVVTILTVAQIANVVAVMIH